MSAAGTTTATATGAVKRKFPPPCWTRDEALVLIQAYRERWYALHRAFLKNPDWDAVAEKVTTACPDVTPPKTSAQCRHKMEKLRQRHRAEKLRASSFNGGRFFSSWFYFEAMEAMENGPNDSEIEINDGSGLIGTPSGTPIGIAHQGLVNPGRGIRIKPLAVQNLVTLAASPNFDSRVLNHTYLEDETPINPINPINEYKTHKNSRVRTPVSNSSPAPRKFSKVVHEHHDLRDLRDREVDENGEMWIKVPRNTNLHQKNNHQNHHQNQHQNNYQNQHQNEGNWTSGTGKKKGNGGIHEVVSSIRLLGDGFMKMEKMKIDMTREIERMRMETEMKRNQLILESQKQIVEAFVKGLIEIRKQQPRTADS